VCNIVCTLGSAHLDKSSHHLSPDKANTTHTNVASRGRSMCDGPKERRVEERHGGLDKAESSWWKWRSLQG